MAETNEQQQLFVVEYVANGGNATKAAVSAGYSQHSAAKIGGNLTRKDHVAVSIREEQRRVIDGELCSLALGALRRVLTAENPPLGALVDAAKAALDRGGLSARQGAPIGGDVSDKPASEMTVAELAEFIGNTEARLTAKRAGGADPLPVPMH